MSKPFDAASKELVELDPAGWLRLLDVDRPADRVKLVDGEVSTVTAAADKVINVADDPPWLAHLEFQANWDGTLPARTLMYNAVLHVRHKMPVASVVILLRPEADSPGVSGRLPFAPPLGPAWEFRCTVLRVWREPASRFLSGPLGVLPLAPSAEVSRADIADVIWVMKDRIDREADRPTAAKLWIATYMFLGLRYEAAFADALLRGITNMEESTTYQAILQRGREEGLWQSTTNMEESTTYQAILRRGRQEGRPEEARVILLRQGRRRFGEPPARADAALAGLDLDRLEALLDRVLDAASWDDLLPPAPAA